jgi:hypothetical protein
VKEDEVVSRYENLFSNPIVTYDFLILLCVLRICFLLSVRFVHGPVERTIDRHVSGGIVASGYMMPAAGIRSAIPGNHTAVRHDMGRFVNGHPSHVLAAARLFMHGSPHATSFGMSEATLSPVARGEAALPSTPAAHPTVFVNSPVAHSECDIFISPTNVSSVSCKFSKEQIIAFGGI